MKADKQKLNQQLDPSSSVPKRPYHPPKIESEDLFEGLATGCDGEDSASCSHVDVE